MYYCNMYSFETKLRVRYGETDQMGFVYYGVYAQYYEVGRVELLRSLGISYKEIEAMGFALPVASIYQSAHPLDRTEPSCLLGSTHIE